MLRSLVLNADYSFLNITRDGFDSVCLSLTGRLRALAMFDKPLRSANTEFEVPAVLVKNDYVNVGRRRQSFTLPSHKNVWVREKQRCAYCNKPLGLRAVTLDHVHPRSKGGRHDLLNVVAACTTCNAAKADLTLAQAGMKLRDDVELRQLTEDEKLSVILKTHDAVERKAWLNCFRREGISLF